MAPFGMLATAAIARWPQRCRSQPPAGAFEEARKIIDNKIDGREYKLSADLWRRTSRAMRSIFATQKSL
jgi:hypothetical protein